MKSLKILIISLAFFSFLTATAQKERNTIYRIGVGELIYTPPTEGRKTTSVLKDVAEVLLSGQTTKQQPQYAEAVRASLMNGLSKVILFRPSDGIVSQTDLSDGIPSFFVDGTIANISVVSRSETTKDSKGNKHTDTSYRSNLSVTVNLKNPADGSVVDSRTFTISDSDLYWMTSGEKAMTNALERLTTKVTDYYNHLFPLQASIIEKGESKKNKQKDVYIDLGASDGAYKGQQFEVFTVKTIAGKEARAIIGRLKIEEVEGDEISLCKVTKGSDKIKSALDDGENLIVVSR
jgi:hypothetical protein